MKAMIFAAGLGTRLKPITDRIPKALLPIGGKTLLQWQLEKLQAAGITDVVINIHHFAEQIIDYCATHTPAGMHIAFSDERDMLLETGGGLRKAATLLAGDEPVLVLNVDVLSNIDIRSLVAAHQPDSLATIVVSERQTQRYFLFNDRMLLRGWKNFATGAIRPEQLTDADQLRPLAFSGMHIVSPRIFRLMHDYPEKFSIVDFYINTCTDEAIRAYIPDNYRMMDIGKIDHLQEAEQFTQSLIQ